MITLYSLSILSSSNSVKTRRRIWNKKSFSPWNYRPKNGIVSNYFVIFSVYVFQFEHTSCRWFTDLLQYADVAQQAFSAATVPTLHNALPAIEALHASWYKRIDRVKYAPFRDALISATAKLDEYYTKTSASDSHILAMGNCLTCSGPS